MRYVFAALLVVPLVEIVVIIAIGQAIGGWWTFLLLLFWSLVGAYLVRREGARTWAALREALATGQMPARELADAALVLIGGTLLLAPGFVTDAVGLFLILPFTRPLTRRWLQASVERQLWRRTGIIRGDTL
ncbi:MAG TPA: FxsA family protein [Segeticoccus sp.]|nr:FxsA family protein [Segeticoccus sp.]